MLSTVATDAAGVPTLGPIALVPDAVAAVPLEPVEGLAGVRQRVLWRSGESVAGELELDPGQHVEAHVHHHAHHHEWVVAGTIRVLGRDLGPGSYVHVPAGVDHDMVVVGDAHVRLFYVYLVAD